MSITIAAYAAAKCLPVSFLADLGLREAQLRGETVIAIPYPEADCVRYRLMLEKGADGDRRFQWKPGSSPTFYGLDRLEQARSAGHVIVVEGESDCHALWLAGLPAIGVPGGSMFATVLKRAPQAFDGIGTVYVVDERDGGAKTLLEALRKSPIADRVRVLDLAPHKDPSERFIALATAVPVEQAQAELVTEMECAMAQAAPLVRRTPARADAAGDDSDSLVDSLVDNGSPAAIAATIAAGDLPSRLRWLGRTMQTWACWDGRRWAASTDRLPLALQVAIRHAVADGIDRRLISLKSVNLLESAPGMRGIGQQASAYPAFQLDPDEVDPPGLVVFQSHVMDTSTGERLAHDPARPVTRCTGVDPGPTCAQWDLIEQHLRACLGDGYAAVHRYLGSCLLGRGADRKLLWLRGPGEDGKSTLMKVLRHALGDYCTSVPAEVFATEGGRGAHQHELASGMAGARLAIALEVGRRLDWAKLKGISGGDEQVSKRIYGRSFTIRRPPLLVLVSNDMPETPDQASADRIILAQLHPPTEPDERLMQVLADDGPGRDALAAAALGWLVRGCSEFMAEGLGPIPTITPAPAGLEAWMAARVAAGVLRIRKGWTRFDTLAADARGWLEEAGELVPPDRDIGKFLKSRLASKRLGTDNKLHYGVSLHEPTR